ncbi:MAG: 16S rRNA (guanine(966)-N(2))-methyltransferase RsmD [Sphaerochaetaceae bacterium]|nr:16S rRNA (guanine(966)-N(2))-methyltransferase RsmD [Sphaerochaetaceae bacterium]MDD3671234.1 16S rRNA (guanine(966)-N(2))-methyltransferase RsmD [Sphaerochaetaceae bacterium]MDD4258486.1 16S rRNA (guanine(966)-N(2))-methyltransferase RsmD [Sphaerochaetaceae bacterium]MDD4762278.1 16S rRNA (guanine(966)-N(2))-methyltransferase RsmD [Sphaerochaetaceae bacterium]
MSFFHNDNDKDNKSMRITGGKYCGRTVKCPPGEIRPAMDRMRTSLFAILGNLEDLSFLDLFSGSGAVGIEAASRGASPVHLVELDKGKRATIIENISFVEEPITLFVTSAQRFIHQAKQTYDIVYADPPFPFAHKVTLVELIAMKQVVNEKGLFIIHYPAEERKQWPDQIGDLIFYDERAYGRSLVRFYQRQTTIIQ